MSKLRYKEGGVWKSIAPSQKEFDDNKAETTALLADMDSKKASKTELANVLDGTPKGTYATLALLQAAFPTGTTGVYIVTADGHIYSWSGSAWVDRGLYQAVGIADGSINVSKASVDLLNKINSIEVLEADPVDLWQGRQWLIHVPTTYLNASFTGVDGVLWDSVNWRNTVRLNPTYLTPESFAGINANRGEIAIATTSATQLVTIQITSQTRPIKMDEYRELEFEITDYLTDAHTIAGFSFAICPTIPLSTTLFPQANWIRLFMGYEVAGRYISLQQKVSGVLSAVFHKETISTNTGLKKYRFVIYNQNKYRLERWNGTAWGLLVEVTNANIPFTDAYIVIERNTYGTPGMTLQKSYIDNVIVKD